MLDEHGRQDEFRCAEPQPGLDRVAAGVSGNIHPHRHGAAGGQELAGGGFVGWINREKKLLFPHGEGLQREGHPADNQFGLGAVGNEPALREPEGEWMWFASALARLHQGRSDNLQRLAGDDGSALPGCENARGGACFLEPDGERPVPHARDIHRDLPHEFVGGGGGQHSRQGEFGGRTPQGGSQGGLPAEHPCCGRRFGDRAILGVGRAVLEPDRDRAGGRIVRVRGKGQSHQRRGDTQNLVVLGDLDIDGSLVPTGVAADVGIRLGPDDVGGRQSGRNPHLLPEGHRIAPNAHHGHAAKLAAAPAEGDLVNPGLALLRHPRNGIRDAAAQHHHQFAALQGGGIGNHFDIRPGVGFALQPARVLGTLGHHRGGHHAHRNEKPGPARHAVRGIGRAFGATYAGQYDAFSIDAVRPNGFFVRFGTGRQEGIKLDPGSVGPSSVATVNGGADGVDCCRTMQG